MADSKSLVRNAPGEGQITVQFPASPENIQKYLSSNLSSLFQGMKILLIRLAVPIPRITRYSALREAVTLGEYPELLDMINMARITGDLIQRTITDTKHPSIDFQIIIPVPESLVDLNIAEDVIPQVVEAFTREIRIAQLAHLEGLQVSYQVGDSEDEYHLEPFPEI